MFQTAFPNELLRVHVHRGFASLGYLVQSYVSRFLCVYGNLRKALKLPVGHFNHVDFYRCRAVFHFLSFGGTRGIPELV
jgi:hypothetical protein